jgi:aspartyl/glutamyl-tRNA(Asn/Gln) amidotransferase C subunit
MISKEEVLGLAELARLKLSEEEVAGLQKDISSILEYVGQVSALAAGTEKAAPLLRNVLRADEPRAAGDALAGKEKAVRAAFPKQENGYNAVRKIIQKDE